MIYIITGDEEFLIKEKSKELIDNLNQESQLNVDHINGANINYQELLNQISNLSLFDEKKISYIENFFSNFNKKNKKKDIDNFYASLKHLIQNTELIFVELPKVNYQNYRNETLTKKNVIFKQIPNEAQFFELNKISNFQNNREVINWCKKKCQKLDIQIEDDALKELVDLKNNNLRALVNELNKLHAYSDGKKIEKSHVQLLTNEWKEYNIFPIIDSIVAGNGHQVREQINTLILRGEISRQEIMYRIAKQTSEFLKVSSVKNLTKNQIEKEVGIHGYRLQKIIEQVKKEESQYLYNLRIIEKYDFQMKTGLINEKVALDLIISELN
ncbi:MAG: DNA polymerase III subunit delta [Chloroflexi bacterium]|nr:DNA polymerase III subunit delta [Chloroflexota bacterium]